MYIDRENKVIFLHNPNCGGRFIRRCLSQRSDITSAYKYWGPYTRELNIDLSHINKYVLSRFVPDWKDYQVVVLIRNPYNRFMSAWNVARGNNKKIRRLGIEYNSPLSFLRCVDSLNYYEQDCLLRSPEVPWFNPQSYYTDNEFLVLQYENIEDWKLLFNLLGIENIGNIRIKPDYPFHSEMDNILRKLYFEDIEIFDKYQKR